MRLTITRLTYFLTVILWLNISACSKASLPNCEEWEITDEKFSTGGCIDWSCGGRRIYQLIFCGNSLDNAKSGNTIVISEDQCCKKTRTFVRYIRNM